MVNKGLMEQREPESSDDFSGMSEKEIDSDLLFNSSLAFLATPEGTQGIVQTVQGAKDAGTAIGKMAAIVIMRIVKEIKSTGVSLTPEGIFDEDGGLTKVLVVIYTIAAVNGAQVPMEQSFAQAYEVAEADIQKAMSQPTNAMPGQVPNAPVS